MLIHAKSLVKMQVVESVGISRVGTIDNIIVDPENGKVIGFLLKGGFLDFAKKIVVFRDVIDFYQDGILIRDAGCVIDSKEVRRADDVLKKKIFLFGSRVITQNGQNLGRLKDFIFDTNLNVILTLVTQRGFSKEKRIIGAERILTILPKKIIIRDIISKVKASVPKRSRVLEPILS